MAEGVDLAQQQLVLFCFVCGVEVAVVAGVVEELYREVAVAVGVVDEVVLVVFFGRVEVGEGFHFHAEGLGVVGGFLVEGEADEGEVVGCGVVDAGAVACAVVVALAVEAGGVDGFEIHSEQEEEADAGGVVAHMYGFGIAGGVGIDLFVGGVGSVAVGKAHLGGENTVDLTQEVFGAPKATGSKIDFFFHGLRGCNGIELWFL